MKVLRVNKAQQYNRERKLASLVGFEPTTRCLEGIKRIPEMLNNMPVAQIAALSKLSKSYISQVKSGKRPISQKLVDALISALPTKPQPEYLKLFLQSRQAMGVSERTLSYYQERLTKFINVVNYHKATGTVVQRYLNSIPANVNGLATRHASYRTIKTFYRWLKAEYGIDNPVEGVAAPILGKPILPVLDELQVKALIDSVDNTRDRTIIALFVESGLRLTELAGIKLDDINWQGRCIKVLGKGRKVALAPFGAVSENYLHLWLSQHQGNGNIWGLNAWGIASMLRRLETKTGITCNPHTFRRTFAVLLRKAGIDTMTIKELGRWESIEMVQRYTRSFSFKDSMKFYRSPIAFNSN